MSDPIYISFIGEKAVGKSSIVDSYNSKHYNPDLYATKRVETHIMKNTFTGELNVYVYDMAGETHEATIIALCVTCDVIVLVYDKTYRQSFKKIDDFFNIIIQHIHPEKSVVVLLGNKTDDTNGEQVKKDEGYKKHKYLKTDLFIETSAKTGYNINELFQKMEEEVKKKREGNVEVFQKEDTDYLIEPQIQTYICPCTCRCICPSCRCCDCTLV
ncbi:uncharacterized protein LOC134685040 [Mytilus trossulus]|uniref:uncharacterized protein LOC134685040 n=1 Tax=Mytilus trossulus TaxID=6551 RepID=UPI0030051823